MPDSIPPRPALQRGAPHAIAEAQTTSPIARAFAFGPYLLQPERQLLLKNDVRLRIGCRALDILTALVERPGEILSKNDLLARGWPNLVIEESNLKVTVAALRKLFADRADAPDFIATVAGRGYRFIAPVRVWTVPRAEDTASQSDPGPVPDSASSTMPATAARDPTRDAGTARYNGAGLRAIDGRHARKYALHVHFDSVGE